MTVFLNGEPVTLIGRPTVAEMLEQLGIPRNGVAIERNLEIVPRSVHATTGLCEGDKIEVVQVVGGG